MLLGAGFVLTLAVAVPGLGVEVNGAKRWLGAGPLQFQPSELLKLALVLYAVHILAHEAEVGAHDGHPGAAAAARGGRGLRGADDPARHGHRPGGLRLDRRAC